MKKLIMVILIMVIFSVACTKIESERQTTDDKQQTANSQQPVNELLQDDLNEALDELSQLENNT